MAFKDLEMGETFSTVPAMTLETGFTYKQGSILIQIPTRKIHACVKLFYIHALLKNKNCEFQSKKYRVHAVFILMLLFTSP
jgi:hypothetical protein